MPTTTACPTTTGSVATIWQRTPQNYRIKNLPDIQGRAEKLAQSSIGTHEAVG